MSQNVLVPTKALNQVKLMNSSQEMNDFFSTQMKTLCGLIQNLTLEQRMRFNNVTTKIDKLHADFDFAGLIRENSQQDQELCPLPDMPNLFRKANHKNKVKEEITEMSQNVLVPTKALNQVKLIKLWLFKCSCILIVVVLEILYM